jgi:membrane protein implicated in regulation of membrane protease activity
MSNKRSSKLWVVNVISFLLFIVLCITGLLNWLVLPKGYEARGSFLVSLRHFFIAFHEWAALIFMIVVAVHIVLHWPYIKSNLKKYGIIK